MVNEQLSILRSLTSTLFLGYVKRRHSNRICRAFPSEWLSSQSAERSLRIDKRNSWCAGCWHDVYEWVSQDYVVYVVRRKSNWRSAVHGKGCCELPLNYLLLHVWLLDGLQMQRAPADVMAIFALNVYIAICWSTSLSGKCSVPPTTIPIRRLEHFPEFQTASRAVQ